MKIKTAIGLMSGTSMDGIDIAVVETDGDAIVRRGPGASYSYEAAFRRRIADALPIAGQMTARAPLPDDLRQLETAITERHGQAVERFLRDTGIERTDVDLLGFHGQTVMHRPDFGFTVQLGDGAALARQTGITTVYDMRANDMAHGGQGAPLVPVYHRALAAQLEPGMQDQGVAFVNIGGISNATFVFTGEDPVALDCGPGNALIDQWVEAKAGIPYDAGGRIAGEGTADQATVGRYMAAEFFSRKGPKSLDRNDFTLAPLGDPDLSDGAATLARVTAISIARSGETLDRMPQTWIIAGGGAKNASIMAELRLALPECVIITADEAGFSADFMEAECWAYLAVRAERGLPLTFPATTGCREPVSGGVIVSAVP